MTALWIVLGILGFLALLAAVLLPMRVGMRVEYSADGLQALVKIGPFHLDLLKKLSAQPKPKAAAKKKPAPEKAAGTAEKPGGGTDGLKSALTDVKGLLDWFVPRLRFDKLYVHFTAAGDDPFGAAMLYGGASAAFGMILAVLENFFDVRDRDLRTSVDFDGGKPSVYLCLQVTIAVADAVGYLISYGKKKKKTDSVTKERR